MDGFFGIGIQELLLIAIVALIVLGPERLPATFREIAKFIRQVRNLTREFTQQFGDDFKALEDLNPRRLLQQAIESIDEEEEATKGKTPPAKTPTTAKTTPAKTTTTKTTTTNSTKATTQPATKTVTATAPTAKTAPKTASGSEPPADKAQAGETTNTAPQETAGAQAEAAVTPSEAAVTTPAAETENRIAPPEEEKARPLPTEAAVTTSALANGVSNEGQAVTPGDVVATATIVPNGAQDHPITQ